MPRRSPGLVLGAVLGALAVMLPAQGAGADQLASTWANINICSSDQLGARAQLAGDGSTDEMHVRFIAEWLSPDGWAALPGQSTSPWQDAGSAEFTWQQAGWTFQLAVPANGQTYQLRAVAEMKLGSGGSATRTTGPCTVGG